MELWGGPECTVNRVGDRFRDQTELTGHGQRTGDLAAFAELGIKRLRYPVLWERVAPRSPDERDWSWSDARLAELRALGIAPIAGLIHHGSGPRFTTLVRDNFAPLFVDYAAAAAERYPWIEDWTPVNEPLTTARFATLYGHWYPHLRDERAFWTALLNQTDATRGAMKAIRRVNPAARLIQTEDLGHTWSTAPLAGVAEHFNHRRWLTWDLLAGRVTPDHPLWSKIEELGLSDRARAICDDPCPPDVVGVNHYATSDRFLDHRRRRFRGPLPATGYHDLTAARVLHPPPLGLGSLVREAWQRYGVPVAVTECHLGCTREEQMRWLWQSWRTCGALEADGVGVVALTAWALLGNVDWSSLITIDAGEYEPGAFDVRGGALRPTALARVVAALGGDASAIDWCREHPVLAGAGWWKRDVRLEHAPYRWSRAKSQPRDLPACRPILITGATGTLGRAFAGACDLRGLSYVLTDRAALAIDDPAQAAAVLDLHRPWAVVNAAGWVRVDDAEDEADGCMRANADGAAVLAKACAARGIHFTTFSSDLVFDGEAPSGYAEADPVSPLGVYGRSKADAERRVTDLGARALIVRTAAFFSPFDDHNFAIHVEKSLRAGEVVLASDDHVVTPTYVPDLVNATLDLVIDEEDGLWHLTNGEPVSWFEFGRRVAGALGLDASDVRPADPRSLGWRAARPCNAALLSTHGRMLPSLDHALARHAAIRSAQLPPVKRIAVPRRAATGAPPPAAPVPAPPPLRQPAPPRVR